MDDTQSRASLALIGAGLGAAGTADLASAKFTRDSFARWSPSDPARFVIGTIEVGVAGVEITGLRTAKPTRRRGRDAGLDCRLRDHRHPGGDSACNDVPPTPLAAAVGLRAVGG